MRSRIILTVTLVAMIASGTAFAADPPPFSLNEVAPGVWAAIATPGRGTGGNSGFVVGDGGVAVIDTFQSAEAATRLLAAIREKTKLPIRFVINTHYHIDHVAGNGVFRDAGATIVAQRNVRSWERTENLKFWGDSIPPDKKAWIESLTLPDVVFDDSIDLFLGSRRLVVRSMPGHTGSDSIVVVPDAAVIFTGDLFWKHALPNTIDADTAAWVVTDGRLVAEHPDATFVPGHGEVGKATDVATFRGYLDALRGAVASCRERGFDAETLVKAAHAELSVSYAGWSFFEHFIDENIREMDAELAGTKRRPASP